MRTLFVPITASLEIDRNYHREWKEVIGLDRENMEG
jgi:hypothetical protein